MGVGDPAHIRGPGKECAISMLEPFISRFWVGRCACQLIAPKRGHQLLNPQVVVIILLMAGSASAACTAPDCAPDEGWDNFANNLGSDMAPLLALFGEQVTTQYLSESLDWIDSLLFALAPLGIITTIIAAIRVAGSSMLRSLIGRAKESRGNVEAELMSSTSLDVCELWNGDGVVRVLGTPTLHQLIFVESEVDDEKGTTGIYNFREESTRRNLYREKKSPTLDFLRFEEQNTNTVILPAQDAEQDRDVEHFQARRNPPNLSLNVSIKPLPRHLLIIFVVFGLLLQIGVLVFAAITQYKLRLPKNNGVVKGYAFPVFLFGTISLSLGVFLCAHAVERSTVESTWEPKDPSARIIFLQQGGQKVGDQQFECFARRSEGLILTSQKTDKAHGKSALVTIAVIITILGFIAQFFGLRAVHSSVIIMQLFAIMIMTAVRSYAHIGRNSENDIKKPDQVEGYELDWLAKDLKNCETWEVITEPAAPAPKVVSSSDIPPADKTVPPTPPDTSLDKTISPNVLLVDKSVSPPSFDIPQPDKAVLPPSTPQVDRVVQPSSVNTPIGVMKARARLASLSKDWTLKHRKLVEVLQNAIESTINDVFAKMILNDGLGDRSTFEWGVPVKARFKHDPDQPRNANLEQSQTVHLALARKPDEASVWTAWKADENELEAVLCLWVSSLAEADWMRVDPADQQAGQHLNRRLKKVRLIGPATGAMSVDYRLWIYRETAPRQAVLDPENCIYFGWISNGDSGVPTQTHYLCVDTERELATLCAQQLYTFFLHELAGWIKGVGGSTTRRLTSSTTGAPIAAGVRGDDWAQFRLKNTNLASIAGIFKHCGLGTIEEAYSCIISEFRSVEKPPYPYEVYSEARQAAKKLAMEGEWEKAGEIDFWLYGNVNTTNAPRRAIEAEIGSRLRQLSQKFLSDLTKHEPNENLQKMWDRLYSQCQVLSNSGASKDRAFALVTLCITHKRVKLDVDPGKLSGLVFNTMKCLSAEGNEVGVFKAKDPAQDDVFDGTETLARFLWANTIQTWRNTTNGENHLPSKVLTDVLQRSGDLFSGSIFKIYLSNPESLQLAAKMSASAGISDQDIEDSLLPIDLLLIRGYRTPLQMAAEIGNMDVVQQLLNAGADVNATPAPHSGRTALQSAAEGGHQVIIELLLEAGAKIDAPPSVESGRTSLQAAAGAGHAGAVKQLLENKANVDDKPAKILGRTALQAAAEFGSNKIVEMLLAAKASVNAAPAPRGGRTALQAAAGAGHIEIVKLLLSSQASLDAAPASDFGRTALQATAEGGYQDIIRLLLEAGAKIEVSPSSGSGRNALQAAAGAGHEEVVKQLLVAGANVNAEPAKSLGRTALQAALEGGHKNIAKLLLDDGADINAAPAEKQGRTVLQATFEGGHAGMVDLVLSFPFDLEAALHLAFTRGQEELLQKLFDRQDLNVNARDEKSSTPLQRASGLGHERVVRWLLKRPDVDVNLADGKGYTALCTAVEGGHESIVQQLLAREGVKANQADENGDTPLHIASRRGNESIVKLLLAVQDLDLNHLNSHGRTPLFLGVENGRDAVVRQLLARKGIKTKPCAADGASLLSIATRYKHIGVVRELLKRLGSNALVNRANKEGYTPLFIAAQNGDKSIVQELLKRRDIDVNLADKAGQTPLFIAAQNGHGDVVKKLLRVTGVKVDYKDLEGRTALSVTVSDEIKDQLRKRQDRELMTPVELKKAQQD